MKYCLLILLALQLDQCLLAQKKIRLPHELNEISGLEKFNDTVLIAINDSGNSPDVFFIDFRGTILKKCKVYNATNTDWEDLTSDDKGNLYIADVGNNMNNRRDLCIWKLNTADAFLRDSVVAQKISFSYEDQSEFPPNEENLRFDCEAIYWMNDTLHLITKNQSKKPENGKDPYGDTWNRYPEDYVIPDQPENYLAQHFAHNVPYLQEVKNSGIRDLVTAADFSYGVIATLTYSECRAIRLNNSGNSLGDVNGCQSYRFSKLEQWEAIVILSEKVIAVASERHPLLGGPFLAIFTFNEAFTK